MTEARGATSEQEPLHRIVIRGFPLALFAESRRHGEALMREFAFIAEGSGDEANTPARLLELVEVLRGRYGGLSAASDALIEDAAKSGEQYVDLELAAPLSVRRATLELGAMLDEADAFCRAGELLTLATPTEAVEFRRWYLGEFVRQLDGEPPCSWLDWKAR